MLCLGLFTKRHTASAPHTGKLRTSVTLLANLDIKGSGWNPGVDDSSRPLHSSATSCRLHQESLSADPG